MNAAERRRLVGDWIGRFAGNVLRVCRSFATESVPAEDLSQEVWIRVFRRAHLRPNDRPVGSWIHGLAVSVCRDQLRRVRRRRALLEGWGGWRLNATNTFPAEDPLASAKLWLAIEALPERQREVVLLRYISEHSTTETARVLGIAEGSVKSSLFKALRTLRGHLDSPEMRDASHG